MDSTEKMTDLRYLRPRTIEDACALLREHGEAAHVVAGGTAFVLMMQQRLIEPRVIISLQDVGAHDKSPWSGITVDRRTTHIAAGTTLTDIAISPDVRRRHPALATAAGLVGNPRIRNVATIGGNLAEADYASDPPSALISLDAVCVIQGSDGVRELPVSQLLTGFYSTALQPDELITAVLVPRPQGDERSLHTRFVSRSSEDRPCVVVSASGRLRNGSIKNLRVVVGAAAPTPLEFPEIIDTLVDCGIPDDHTVESVAGSLADQIEPIEDQRGSAWYRRQMVRVHVGLTIRAFLAGEGRAEQ